MKINHICCCDSSGAFAADGKSIVPPAGDLARFKQLTTGHAVVMGYKTWASLPNGFLKDRLNIVVLRQGAAHSLNGVEFVDSIGQGLEIASSKGYKELFIIGGQNLYEQSLFLADKVYLTVCDQQLFGNNIRYYPIELIRFPQWQMVECIGKGTGDHVFKEFWRS